MVSNEPAAWRQAAPQKRPSATAQRSGGRFSPPHEDSTQAKANGSRLDGRAAEGLAGYTPAPKGRPGKQTFLQSWCTPPRLQFRVILSQWHADNQNRLPAPSHTSGRGVGLSSQPLRFNTVQQPETSRHNYKTNNLFFSAETRSVTPLQQHYGGHFGILSDYEAVSRIISSRQTWTTTNQCKSHSPAVAEDVRRNDNPHHKIRENRGRKNRKGGKERGEEEKGREGDES